MPPAAVEITRREQLNWERDLIGVYITDHPLSPAMDAIRQNVTHYSSELAETQAQQLVRVAGLITRIRPHTTKKGDPMAFVTLEDLQGNIDLVIFPRTWKQVHEFVEWDAIVMVDGKVDTYGAEPKILVDKITTELTHVSPLDTSQEPTVSQKKAHTKTSQGAVLKLENSQQQQKVAEKPADRIPSNFDDEISRDDDDFPPPPDAFPIEWDDLYELSPTSQAPVEAYSALISAASTSDAQEQEGKDPASVSVEIEPAAQVDEQTTPYTETD